ncbi:MAG: GNAT family N-acetyltransferase [Siphonobacter sp.]
MIVYSSERKINASEFVDVLSRSTLAERRPVDDLARMQAMLDHANVLITAWDGELLVGVSRALSDFSFCTYLSDLAVDEAYQHQGIGKRLVDLTYQAGGTKATLILLAAPKAVEYYPKIGMKRSEVCFLFERKE